METKQSIGQYIGRNTNRFFKIPAYQRGYKWGELKSDDRCDASILVEDILHAMYNGKAEYFIQGVTVYENGSDVVLIDGQQRTTTLFLLLSYLMSDEEIQQYFFFNGQFKLKYDIRLKTQEFLKNICITQNCEAESQDEFFLNQALDKMSFYIADEKKADLKKYTLEKVKLFYIKVPEKRATRVFSMLNGSKAFMTTDELVKSAFLSEASKVKEQHLESKSLGETLENLKSQIGEEWQTTAMRSRYARQWDKWLYWWNKPEVRAFYHCNNNPMGRLLEYFYEYKSNISTKENYSNKAEDVASIFKLFQNSFIQDRIAAKSNFEQLRKLQKTFEDIYSDTQTYNYLGLVLSLSKSKDNLADIHYFVSNFKYKDKLKRFALYRALGVSRTQIEGQDKDEIKNKLSEVIELLSKQDVYNDETAKEYTFKLLFLLNVVASINRKVKFEFFYWEKNKLIHFYSNRSLEHIWPKSKVIHKKEDKNESFIIDEKNNEIVANHNTDKYLNRNAFEKGYSEHCIGNLLFLHKNDNSVFNAKLPEDKKLVYFNLDIKIFSRNLLHTMSAFAIENWMKENTVRNIKSLSTKTIKNIKDIYQNAE